MGYLDKLDLDKKLESKEEYEELLEQYEFKLLKLQRKIIEKGMAVCVAYEGCDASGKGGNIKRLTAFLDPRGYEVIPIAAPSQEEKAHHFLWRFWNQIPKAGHFTIYDRTWYGRVMVERVEGRGGKGEDHEARTAVEVARAEISPGLIRLKPVHELAPGEYALGECVGHKLNLDIWDFGVDKLPSR